MCARCCEGACERERAGAGVRPSPNALVPSVVELLKLAEDKLGYLKIVTPKFAGDDAGAGATSTGRSRFVVSKAGEVVTGADAAAAVAAKEHTARNKSVFPPTVLLFVACRVLCAGRCVAVWLCGCVAVLCVRSCGCV